MAYESEAIAPNTQVNTSTAQPIMREERTLEPNRAQSVPKVSQPIKDVASPKPSAEPDKASTDETVTLAPAAANLARQEHKFRQQEQALKEKEKALEAERAELTKLKELKAKLDAKDYSALDGLVDYNDYTNHLIERATPANEAQQAIKKLEAEVETVKKAHKEDVDKRYEAAVTERRTAIKTLVASNDDYSSIRELKAEEHVVQHILDTFEHDNIELSPEQAAKEVEEILLERATKWSSLPKLKGKSEPEAKVLPPLKTGATKTLTNQMTVSELQKAPKSFQGMTDAQRWAEARRRAEERVSKGTK